MSRYSAINSDPTGYAHLQRLHPGHRKSNESAGLIQDNWSNGRCSLSRRRPKSRGAWLSPKEAAPQFEERHRREITSIDRAVHRPRLAGAVTAGDRLRQRKKHGDRDALSDGQAFSPVRAKGRSHGKRGWRRWKQLTNCSFATCCRSGPIASTSLGDPLLIRSRASALRRPHIQVNEPSRCHRFLVFDVGSRLRPVCGRGCGIAATLLDRPYLRENGHAHVAVSGSNTPVYMWGRAKPHRLSRRRSKTASGASSPPIPRTPVS